MLSLIRWLAVALVLISSPAFSQELAIKEGKTGFLAVGKPSMLRIKAKGDAPKGAIVEKAGKLSGKITVELNSLDTGIGLRNRHMKEKYLETDKYPELIFELKGVELPPGSEKDGFEAEEVPVPGSVTLHGVTRPVNATADLKRKGEELEVETEFKLKVEDFGIEIPSFKGITVADAVTGKAEFTLVPKGGGQ